jgi:hypothetical protein
MARRVRIQYPGTMYHVMIRGNRRPESYRDDVEGKISSSPWQRRARRPLAGACRLPDERPLSSGPGNPKRESGGPHGLAVSQLHQANRRSASFGFTR